MIQLLDELVDQGTPVAANRTYSVLHRFFRYCVERHLIASNPAAAVRKPTQEQSWSRALNDEELQELWAASERLAWPFGPFVRALFLTGQRRNEIAGMVWSELDQGLSQWAIPAERTKNAKEHLVPLSAAVRSILLKAPRFGADDEPEDVRCARPVFTTNGKTGGFGVFPSKSPARCKYFRSACEGRGRSRTRSEVRKAAARVDIARFAPELCHRHGTHWRSPAHHRVRLKSLVWL